MTLSASEIAGGKHILWGASWSLYTAKVRPFLMKKGIDYVVGRGNYGLNSRGQIIGDTGGLLKLIFTLDDMRLVGAHIVGTSASELIHTGLAFLRSEATAIHIAETLYNYPTLSDMYRHAAMEALWEEIQREGER